MKLQTEVLLLAGSAPSGQAEFDQSQLAFHLIAPLPLDLDFKQTLLEMKSEAERTRAVISYFEAILPNLRRSVLCARGPVATATSTNQKFLAASLTFGNGV